jgi:CRISPR-associated protein Cas2
MLIVTYDISNDKLRTKFSKFLEKHGYRLQYSVFQLKNSERILNIVLAEIEGRFLKRFTESDSVLIVPISSADEKKIIKMGCAKHLDDDILFV